MSKISQVRNLLYLIGEKNSQLGYQYSNENYRKGRKTFNTSFVYTFITLFIIRDLISLFISDDFIALLIGDYVHNFRFKIQWNLIFFDAYAMVLMIKLMNRLNASKNTQVDYPKKFNQNVPGAEKMVKLFNFATKGEFLFIAFIGFDISFAFQSINSSFIELISIGLFWCLVFAVFIAFLCELYVLNLVYFVATAFYCKILLKEQNDKIKYLIKSENSRINRNILTTLRDIDILYKKIMAFNKIWSQFLFISWICLAFLISIYFIQIFFVKNQMIVIQMVMIFGLILISSLIISLIIFCSSVNSESKKTFKLLSSMNASKGLLKIWLKNRLNVIKIQIV